MVVVAEATDLDPFQWLARLGAELCESERQDRIARWKRYHDGHQDLPSGPNQHADAYRRFQKLARTNLCLLCAESMVHRMQVVGYRDGSNQEDNPVWNLWQQAKLDARQYAIWRKAFSRSAAYVTVGVDPRTPGRPRVTIEGPENVVVETDPADQSRRLAALRLWHDSIASRWMATLYLPGEGEGLPGRRYRWVTREEYKQGARAARLPFTAAAWESRMGAEVEWERSTPEVPVVPFVNGDEDEEPRAEFDAGMDVQNRLNLTVLNRLTAERYGAFRQRALMNYTPEVDPVTGLLVPPFQPGADAIFTVPPPEPGEPAPQLFDLQQTDTSQMLRGTEADMRAFAAITITPVYYLPGDLVNIGADAVAALDAGHNAKVKQRMAYWGEGLEEVLQLMSDIAELGKNLSAAELVWARPENFNPSQIADYASKLVAAGFPLTMVAEEIGWSPQRVAELRAEMARQDLLTSLTAPPAVAARPASVGSSNGVTLANGVT